MPIESIDLRQCRGCGKCDQVCPMDVIYFDRQRQQPAIRYPKDCQSCYLCVLSCAAGSIHVTPWRNLPLPSPANEAALQTHRAES